MKIFILEDNLKRIEQFCKLFSNKNIIYTACTKEAISILTTECFDIIFLDHDLSEITTLRADGTGYEVANFLGNFDTPNNRALIVIHTMNPEGADSMMGVLKNRNACRILYTDIQDHEMINRFIAINNNEN
ncbi:MAG: cyclic-phosphate processing receiver domain-containing protein [Acidobacteriota bacterium]